MSAVINSCDHVLRVVELMSTVQTMHAYNQRVITECKAADCDPSTEYAADVITTFMKYESEQQNYLGLVISDIEVKDQYAKLLSAYAEILAHMDTLKRLVLRKTLISAALKAGAKGNVTKEALDKAFDEATANVIAAATEAQNSAMRRLRLAVVEATPALAPGDDDIPVAEAVPCTLAQSVTAEQ